MILQVCIHFGNTITVEEIFLPFYIFRPIAYPFSEDGGEWIFFSAVGGASIFGSRVLSISHMCVVYFFLGYGLQRGFSLLDCIVRRECARAILSY